MGLLDDLLPSRRRAASLEADLAGFRAELRETREALEAQKNETARLEGLLDLAEDPDATLGGVANAGLYRELVGAGHGASTRDFDETTWRRMIRQSHLAHALRGDGENLIDIHRDFIVGDGLRPRSKDENDELDDAIDEVWKDPRNRLDVCHDELTWSLLLEGELTLRAELSEIDGHLELAWTDPLQVEKVLQDRRGRDAFLQVTNPAEAGKPWLWFNLANLTDEVAILPWPEDRSNPEGYRYAIQEVALDPTTGFSTFQARGAHGLAFYFPWNRPSGATRGRGELFSVLDLIDADDELVFSAVDVQNLKRWFVLHLKDAGIRSGKDARDKLKEYKLQSPPRNPRVIATNAQVELDLLKSPAADSEEWLGDAMGIRIYGAKGFPLSWRGDTKDANLAAARASDAIPFRRLRRKQKRVLGYWRRLIEVSLELRRRARSTAAEGEIVVETLEVGGKDRQRGAELMKAVSTAVAQALAADAIKPELANALLVQAAREAGFTVKADQEGVPEDFVERQLDALARQLGTQRNRDDGDGNQDEEDRDRAEERVGA